MTGKTGVWSIFLSLVGFDIYMNLNSVKLADACFVFAAQSLFLVLCFEAS